MSPPQGGPPLPFHATFAASAIAACTAEVTIPQIMPCLITEIVLRGCALARLMCLHSYAHTEQPRLLVVACLQSKHTTCNSTTALYYAVPA